jgi:GNAT superfamily N-acetyltransferase
MSKLRYIVRQTKPADIIRMIRLCQEVYPESPAWSEEQLISHQAVFPEGQFVVEDRADGTIVGFAASLIVNWDDYEWTSPWRDFTAGGYFTNHDPRSGRTLYGAEIMISPKRQGTGAGTKLYLAREELAKRLGLLRIRAGARLRNYHRHAKRMSAEQYVHSVIDGKLRDPTLSFQLKRGFHVLRVIAGYLRHDPESLGYAAVIEWINPAVAKPEDFDHQRESEFHKSPLGEAKSASDHR